MIQNEILESFNFFLCKTSPSKDEILKIEYSAHYYFNKNENSIEENLYLEYNHYKNKLKQQKLYRILDSSGIEQNVYDAYFLNYIMDNINDEIIKDYERDGNNMDFLNHTLFQDYFNYYKFNDVILYFEKAPSSLGFILPNNNFTIEDEESFFLRNQIYIPTEVELTNRTTGYSENFPLKKTNYRHYISFEYDTTYFEDLSPEYLDDYKFILTLTQINPKFLTYAIGDFIQSNLTDFYTYEVELKIQEKLNLSLDTNEKLKILKKEIKKKEKRYHKIDIPKYLAEINFDFKKDSNIELISVMLEDDYFEMDELIKGYLRYGLDFNFLELNFFNDWFNLCWLKSTITIFKKKYKNIKLDSKKGGENIKNYNSKIFKSAHSEKIFNEILVRESVIDGKNKPLRRFNTVTYNIFKINNRLHNLIFNTKQLNIYTDFLIKKYNITLNDKTKLGNSNHNLQDQITSFIEEKVKTN